MLFWWTFFWPGQLRGSPKLHCLSGLSISFGFKYCVGKCVSRYSFNKTTISNIPLYIILGYYIHYVIYFVFFFIKRNNWMVLVLLLANSWMYVHIVNLKQILCIRQNPVPVLICWQDVDWRKYLKIITVFPRGQESKFSKET